MSLPLSRFRFCPLVLSLLVLWSPSVGWALGESAYQAGYSADASGDKSTAVGYDNTASGWQSSAFGYQNTASAGKSSAFGYLNTAGAWYSSAFGHANSINSNVSGGNAFGERNTLEASYSNAFGSSNRITASYGLALGRLNNISGSNAMALGAYNEVSSKYSMTLGFMSEKEKNPEPTTFSKNDKRLLTVANGSIRSGTFYPSNALVLQRDGDLWIEGDLTSDHFGASSDGRLKKNIATLSKPLEMIESLRGVSFTWKKNNKPSIGFIAQEVEKVIPSLVLTGEDGYKTVAYGQFTALLVEAVKELKSNQEVLWLANNELLTQNQELSAQNKALEKRVTALETR